MLHLSLSALQFPSHGPNESAGESVTLVRDTVELAGSLQTKGSTGVQVVVVVDVVYPMGYNKAKKLRC